MEKNTLSKFTMNMGKKTREKSQKNFKYLVYLIPIKAR
jgi:hypothetical protein